MRFVLLLAPFALLALSAEASANSCNAYTPFATTPMQLDAACKMVVYVSDGYTLETTNLQTVKDNVYGTYDAPFTKSALELDVELHDWEDENGECVEHITKSPQRYWRYELDVSSLPIGTELRTPGGAAIITAEGSCAEGEKPFLYCQEPIQDTCLWDDGGNTCGSQDPHGFPCGSQDEDQSDGGCNAGGGSAGVGLALGLLALRTRRRARH